MAGGGFRFAYYLGMYAACEQYGKKPDLILASCGAAIAAAMIHRLPDDAARRDWLASAAMYQFWQSLHTNSSKTLAGALSGVVRRALLANITDRIPDLFEDYLFELPDRLPLPDNASYASAPDLAIIAGRLLYEQHEVGQKRAGRKLFTETVFANARVEQLLSGMHSPLAEAPFDHSAVTTTIQVVRDMPLADAARASISDMYYFRCHQIGGQHYLGGVLDLFPIELANRLAQEVMMERKGLYNRWIDLPAVRMVLGIHGNQRLRQVLNQRADYWIDTSDMETVLAKGQIHNHIDWMRNRFALRVPHSLSAYRDMLNSQWEYGYGKAVAAIHAKKSPEL